MLNDVLNAVALKLERVFIGGENNITIYTDQVKQGFQQPCFFVGFLETSQKRMISNRYRESVTVYIQYLNESASTIEKNEIVEQLYDNFELLETEGGLLRGINMKQNVDDLALNFLVNYNYFIMKEKDMEEKMENFTYVLKGGKDG